MHIIIEGAGEVGTHLAKMLSSEVNDITVIDNDKSRLSKISTTVDVMTIASEPSSMQTLRQAEVEKADLFIGVNPYTKQDVNIVSALLAKKLGCKKVCARIDNEEYLSQENKYIFTEMGIDLMFYPEKIVAAEISDLLKRTASSENMDFARGKLQMPVFKIDDDSPIVNISVGEFAAAFSKGGTEFRVIAISRGPDTIIPGRDTKFRTGDLVFIMTKREGVDQIMDYMGKEEIHVDKVMVMGGGQIGRLMARSCAKDVSAIKVIDIDKQKCIELSEETPDNVLVVNGDGRNSDFLEEEGVRDYDAFVAVTGNDEANILTCIVAKNFGVERTIAEVENTEYIKLAEEMGVDAVINKKLLTAGRIFKMTLSDKVRFVKYMSGTNAEVLEYIVAEGSPITEAPLREIDFPKGAIVGGVIRERDAFIAIGTTKIEPYDRVVVFALPENVKEVNKFFRDHPHPIVGNSQEKS